MDIFLFGHLKDNIYDDKPETIEQPKSDISREMRKITPDMCVNVIENFKRKLNVVIAKNERHTEHLL